MKKNVVARVKPIILSLLLVAYLLNGGVYVNSVTVLAKEEAPNELINAYTMALSVILGLENADKAAIKDEYDIATEDGKLFGKALGYTVMGEPYGYAVYDSERKRIVQFVFEKGVKNIYEELSLQAEDANAEIEKTSVADGLVIDDENPFCLKIIDKQGNTYDNFKVSDYLKGKDKIEKIYEKLDDNKKAVLQTVDYDDLFHFDKEGELKPFVRNRYGKKYYSGYSNAILSTFTQDSIERNADRQYACSIVSAMVMLRMLNCFHNNDIWKVYTELYDTAGTENGGVFLYDVGLALDRYFGKYYPYNGYLSHTKTTNVRFADIKKVVDSDYKSSISLWTANAAHSVPVLGYYSYYFSQQNCVDYVIVAANWYDTNERYFDSVYFNGGEMAAESHLMYLTPYKYSVK